MDYLNINVLTLHPKERIIMGKKTSSIKSQNDYLILLKKWLNFDYETVSCNAHIPNTVPASTITELYIGCYPMLLISSHVINHWL